MRHFLFKMFCTMPYCILRILDCLIGFLLLGQYVPKMAFMWTDYIVRKHNPNEQMGS